MTLRLVLVSLVAALGLTIPGVPMIESWVASTQNWMNARFADWDTRNPQTADYVIVSDYYDAERLAPRPAISSIPVALPTHSSATQERSKDVSADATRALSSKAPLALAAHATHVRPASFVRKVAVFEPIEVGETLCLGFAEELNRRSEGIGVVPPRATPASVPRPLFELNKMTPSLYRGITSLMVQWNKIAASLPPRAASPLPPRRRIEPMMVFENLYGGIAPGKTIKKEVAPAKPVTPKTEVVQAKPVTPTVAPTARAQAQAPRPVATLVTSFGAMESSPSLYFAGDLNVPAKTVVSALPAPAVALTPKPEPKPAPKAVPAVATKPTAVAAGPKPSDPPAEPQEGMDDLEIEVTGALLPQDDGFGILTLAPVKKAPAPAPKPRFVPLEVGPEFSVGIAYELNRRSEGLQIATPPFPAAPRVATSTSTPRPTRELNRAVKLTRDAVYAWVNVFTGPALVTVSQSEDKPLGR